LGLVSPSQSNAGDEITAAKINNPINQLAAQINGNIDTNNIADSAITTAKVAAGLNASKLSNPYKFSVFQNALISLPADIWTKAQLNTELFDTNNNFDNTTTYRYTVPVTGFYQINAQVGVTQAGASSGVYMQGAIYKNGVAISLSSVQMASGNANSILRASMNRLLQLSAGDYLEMYAKCGESRQLDGDAAATVTYMTGFLVSTT
jgi:hypothetical protein